LEGSIPGPWLAVTQVGGLTPTRICGLPNRYWPRFLCVCGGPI